MHTQASSVGRIRNEVWRKSFDAIGIRVPFKSVKKGELIKSAQLGQVQMLDAKPGVQPQSVLSFLFNSAIIGMLINMAAGLVSNQS